MLRTTYQDFRSPTEDLPIAKHAATVAVMEFEKLPTEELSLQDQNAAERIFRHLTWIGVQELELARIAKYREDLTDDQRAEVDASLLEAQIELVQVLIRKLSKVGGRRVRRPDDSYALVKLNEARINELEQMLADLTQ
jgi:hypothetical protein